MKKGDRVQYTGPHTPWVGLTGVIREVIEPFPKILREPTVLYKMKWDDPPGKLDYAFITPYNIKQWSMLDDTSTDDREVHSAAKQG